VERWSAVSLFLENLGYRVFLAGGSDDISDISGVPGTCLAGKLTWGQTAALLSGAALFAGNDSGPAHLAVSSGTQALVLFGPTDPEALYPPGSIVPVRTGSPCAPCYSNSVFQGCRGNGECMSSITPEEVIETIRGII
jgi:ADP-heptose:LPS heptosyltransferase